MINNKIDVDSSHRENNQTNNNSNNDNCVVSKIGRTALEGAKDTNITHTKKRPLQSENSPASKRQRLSFFDSFLNEDEWSSAFVQLQEKRDRFFDLLFIVQQIMSCDKKKLELSEKMLKIKTEGLASAPLNKNNDQISIKKLKSQLDNLLIDFNKWLKNAESKVQVLQLMNQNIRLEENKIKQLHESQVSGNEEDCKMSELSTTSKESELLIKKQEETNFPESFLSGEDSFSNLFAQLKARCQELVDLLFGMAVTMNFDQQKLELTQKKLRLLEEEEAFKKRQMEVKLMRTFEKKNFYNAIFQENSSPDKISNINSVKINLSEPNNQRSIKELQDELINLQNQAEECLEELQLKVNAIQLRHRNVELPKLTVNSKNQVESFASSALKASSNQLKNQSSLDSSENLNNNLNDEHLQQKPKSISQNSNKNSETDHHLSKELVSSTNCKNLNNNNHSYNLDNLNCNNFQNSNKKSETDHHLSKRSSTTKVSNLKNHRLIHHNTTGNFENFKKELEKVKELFDKNLKDLKGKIKLPELAQCALDLLTYLIKKINPEVASNQQIAEAAAWAAHLLSQMKKSDEIISLYKNCPFTSKRVTSACISALCAIQEKKVAEIFNVFKSEGHVAEFSQIIRRAIEEDHSVLSEIQKMDNDKLIQLMTELSKHKRTDLIRKIEEEHGSRLTEVDYLKFQKIMTYAYFRSGDFGNANKALEKSKLTKDDIAWIDCAQIRALLKVKMKKQALQKWQKYQDRIDIDNTVGNIEIEMAKGLYKLNEMKSVISHFESKKDKMRKSKNNLNEYALRDILIRTLLEREEIRLAWKILKKILDIQNERCPSEKKPSTQICNHFLAALYKEKLKTNTQSSLPSSDTSKHYPDCEIFFKSMGGQTSFPNMIKHLPHPNSETYVVRIIGEFSIGGDEKAKKYLDDLLENTKLNIRPLLDNRHFNILFKKLIGVNRLKEAEDLFNNPNLDVKNTKSYSILMKGYLKNNKPEEVKRLFGEMEKVACFQSIDIYNLYLRSMEPKESINFFESMKKNPLLSELNSSSYNICIEKCLKLKGVLETERHRNARKYFEEMKKKRFVTAKTRLVLIENQSIDEALQFFYDQIKVEDREEVFYELLVKRLLEDGGRITNAMELLEDFEKNNKHNPFRRTLIFDLIAGYYVKEGEDKAAIDFANKYFDQYWNGKTIPNLNARNIPPLCTALLIKSKLETPSCNKVEILAAEGLYLQSNEYQIKEKDMIQNLGEGYKVIHTKYADKFNWSLDKKDLTITKI